MATYHDLFDIGKKLLAEINETQQEQIKKAAAMMGDCMLENGLIQLCGLDYNHAFTMELFYRAGGLMPYHGFNPRDLVVRGHVSYEEYMKPDFMDRKDLVDKMWDIYNVHKNDMFVLSSDLGDRSFIIDLAIKAKELGHKVIVVTSLKEAKKVAPKHASGKKLYELADLVIDTCIPNPDVVLPLKGKGKINQVSTFAGNTIAQMLTAEIYKYLTELNHEAPVLLSANVTGADIHNRAISDKYLGRWNA